MNLGLSNKQNDGSALNEYLVIITGCAIFFLLGAHVSWTSPFLPRLQSDEYPFEISNEEASLITIFAPIGDIFGEICSTIGVDYIGRRNTLALGGIPMLSSCILIYFSYLTPYLLYVARFLGGICFGTVMSIAPMYISEISRPEIRGKLGTLTAFAVIGGCISVNLIGNYFDIQIASIFLAAISTFYLVTFSFMPESPYYYLMKEKMKNAEESLKVLRRKNCVQDELSRLSKDVERQMGEGRSFKDLVSINSNRKAITLMIVGRIFQQLTGITAFTMFAQNILEGSREIIQPQISILVIYSIQAFSSILAGNLSDRFGRVPLLTWSTASCSVVLFLLGGYFTIRDFSEIEVTALVLVFLYGIFFVAFQMGLGGLLNVITGEMFSASIKPKAICIVNIFFSLLIIITAKLFQISVDYLHISYCLYFFGCCSIIGTLFFKFCFMETKGKTLEEIQMDLKVLRRKSIKTSN